MQPTKKEIISSFVNSQDILQILKENNIRDDIDYFYFHIDRFNFLMKKIKNYFKPGKVFLDIASFRGYMMIGASLIGYKVFGTDLAPEVTKIETLSQKYQFINLPADLAKDRLPFDDSTCDVIVCSEVLEHLNFNPRRVFMEIARVLKKDGIIIVTTPNLTRLNNVVKMLCNKSINTQLDTDFHTGTHYREYTSKEVCYLMKYAGLHIEEQSFINFKYPRLGILVSLSDTLTKFFVHRKRDLCIIGKK